MQSPLNHFEVKGVLLANADKRCDNGSHCSKCARRGSPGPSGKAINSTFGWQDRRKSFTSLNCNE